MEADLICYPGSISVDGTTVPHIMLAPPMILKEQHMHECMDRLEQTLDRVFQSG